MNKQFGGFLICGSVVAKTLSISTMDDNSEDIPKKDLKRP